MKYLINGHWRARSAQVPKCTNHEEFLFSCLIKILQMFRTSTGPCDMFGFDTHLVSSLQSRNGVWVFYSSLAKDPINATTVRRFSDTMRTFRRTIMMTVHWVLCLRGLDRTAVVGPQQTLRKGYNPIRSLYPRVSSWHITLARWTLPVISRGSTGSCRYQTSNGHGKAVARSRTQN